MFLIQAHASPGPDASRTQSCVHNLSYDWWAPRRRPSRARELIKIRNPREADERFPDPPGVGYRLVRLEWPYPPSHDPRVGRWMILPVNEPFALDTYTSLVELNGLHAQSARATDEGRRRIIGDFLRLPPRVTEAMDWSPFADGRAIERRLGAHLWARGRRLHCYDDEGVIY